MKKGLLIFSIFLILSPAFVFAQDLRFNCPPDIDPDALVPCGGPTCPCTFCDFFVMIDNIVDFLLTRVVPVVAVLMIVIVGAMMIAGYAGQSGPEMINKAKKFLLTIIIGLFIVYLAWIIINLFLVSIGVADWTGLDRWWIINCDVGPVIPPIEPPVIEGCTDPTALNFDPDATRNDGSCIYEEGEGICGDSIIQTPNSDGVNEVCDRENLGGRTCMFYGFGPEAVGLACQADCLDFDPSGCSEPPPPEDPCGNGVIDEEIGEQCDWNGPALGGETCETQGFPGGGALGCTFDCEFDFSGCFADPCGNGVIDAGELCDWNGPQLRGQTCESLGFLPGVLDCSDDCQSFDTSGCGDPTICGDNIIQRPNSLGDMEVCDGSDLGGQTCESQGFPPGDLNCLTNCLGFDYSECRPEEDRCLSCPGNEAGLCDIINCPVAGGCNYVRVDLLMGRGGICVNPTDCNICGTMPLVPTNKCDDLQCNAIGAPCEYLIDSADGLSGVCYLDGQCHLCNTLLLGCTNAKCRQLGDRCIFVPGDPFISPDPRCEYP